MDWHDETWVKLYRRNTTDWLALSVGARGLFCLLLRAVNRKGALDLGKTGLRAVAVHMRGEWKEIEPCLRELLDDGCVQVDGYSLMIRNFVVAQEAVQSERARQKAHRERLKSEPPAEPDVTKRDDGITKRDATITPRDENVTPGHAASRAVTRRHEEKRREENRRDEKDNQSTPNGVLPQQQPSAAVAAVADGSAKVDPSKPEKATKGKVDWPAPQPGTPAAHIADAISRAGSLRGLVKRPHSLAEAATVAYVPALDVAGEIAKANGWCISNPATAPKSDGDRFLWSWLTRAHAKVTEIAARDGQRGTLGQHASASSRRPGAAPVAAEYAPLDNPEVLEVHELERRKAAARAHR
jgi:hypothetical protein